MKGKKKGRVFLLLLTLKGLTSNIAKLKFKKKEKRKKKDPKLRTILFYLSYKGE